MSIGLTTSDQIPDYDLDERRIVTDRRAVAAMFQPLRSTILDLLLERAATVGELATAVDRPASSVAYHVGVLARADLVRVVRTRRVRAVTERCFGRTARVFVVGVTKADEHRTGDSTLTTAATEAEAAHLGDSLRAIHRHARISNERAEEFWQRALQLASEFSGAPRDGEITFAFLASLYPTDAPTLPRQTD